MTLVLVRDAGLMPWGEQSLLFVPRHAIPMLHNRVPSPDLKGPPLRVRK